MGQQMFTEAESILMAVVSQFSERPVENRGSIGHGQTCGQLLCIGCMCIAVGLLQHYTTQLGIIW